MKKIVEYLREVVPPSSPIRWGYSAARGVATAAAFGLPGRGVRGIGVTGTDGKTTTTAMIAHLLRGAGQRVVESNSLGITHANGRQQAIAQKRTTPSARVMQLLFRAARAERAALITELSSHALLHRRAAGLRLDVAVLTNLSAEHLDMHGSVEHYLRAKSAIFWRHLRPGGVALLGSGPGCDALAERLGQRFRVERLTKPNNISTLQTGGTRFCWQGKMIEMPAAGAEIMATNMAAALTAAQHFLQKKYGTKDEKVHREALISAAENFAGVPGRMQPVPLVGADFLAFVDFAVTPAAVRAALVAARAQIGRGGRVIGVVGAAGGQHDRAKRPAVGAALLSGADIGIVTDDEPFGEPPERIRADILRGHPQLLEIPGRRRAIAAALKRARPGDAVIVMGMGAMQTRTLANGKEQPWDEAAVLREVWEARTQ